MATDDPGGKTITIEEATKLTRIYRNSLQFSNNHGIKAHYFSKGLIDDLLKPEGCIGVRIYHGLEYDENGNAVPRLVLTGVDKDNNDMTSEKLLDRGDPCPPYCTGGNKQLSE